MLGFNFMNFMGQSGMELDDVQELMLTRKCKTSITEVIRKISCIVVQPMRKVMSRELQEMFYNGSDRYQIPVKQVMDSVAQSEDLRINNMVVTSTDTAFIGLGSPRVVFNESLLNMSLVRGDRYAQAGVDGSHASFMKFNLIGEQALVIANPVTTSKAGSPYSQLGKFETEVICQDGYALEYRGVSQRVVLPATIECINLTVLQKALVQIPNNSGYLKQVDFSKINIDLADSVNFLDVGLWKRLDFVYAMLKKKVWVLDLSKWNMFSFQDMRADHVSVAVVQGDDFKTLKVINVSYPGYSDSNETRISALLKNNSVISTNLCRDLIVYKGKK